MKQLAETNKCLYTLATIFNSKTYIKMKKLVASAFSFSVLALVMMSTSFDNSAFEANTVSSVANASTELAMDADGRNFTSGTLSVNGVSSTGTQSFSLSSGSGTGSFSSSTTTETGTFSSSSSSSSSSYSSSSSSRTSRSSSTRTSTTGGLSYVDGGESCDYITNDYIASLLGCN